MLYAKASNAFEAFDAVLNGTMNLDSLTAALSHIGNLVASLTKKNLNSSAQEIQEVSVLLLVVWFSWKCLMGELCCASA